jgi:hypothetical protein
MPSRSIRDIMQGTLHSLGIAKEDPPVVGFTPADDPHASPTSPTPPKTEPVKASDALQNRGAKIDQAVEDASK